MPYSNFSKRISSLGLKQHSQHWIYIFTVLKNSALGEDLDWERNVKPPPVITEEVSQSIEELIMKRISEGHFDDVQKVNKLPSKAPREMKELDENQSKKDLGELYADEYAQKTGLVSQALSFSDEQKKEASLLFKRLCLKLDAHSHLHFTPKPVIEDMSIQKKCSCSSNGRDCSAGGVRCSHAGT
ncbi:putative U3 small nucleolar ribonucleoprotein complex, subunit Mpp10 [Helianthus annuus]|nr:putative U3 small nucleolar ribonucleoprotein complex, subunit Mpp10 [Helianthus annuus]